MFGEVNVKQGNDKHKIRVNWRPLLQSKGRTPLRGCHIGASEMQVMLFEALSCSPHY